MIHTDGTVDEFVPYAPEWGIFVMDITQYCSADFVARCGGGVYHVYFFNKLSRTFICSYWPMAELRLIGTVAKVSPDDEDAREALDDELRSINEPEVEYVDFDDALEQAKTAYTNKNFISPLCETWEDVEDEAESVREYCCGNGVAEAAVDHFLKAKGD